MYQFIEQRVLRRAIATGLTYQSGIKNHLRLQLDFIVRHKERRKYFFRRVFLPLS
jgi:hypothetical protein